MLRREKLSDLLLTVDYSFKGPEQKISLIVAVVFHEKVVLVSKLARNEVIHHNIISLWKIVAYGELIVC